jgi:hypothetical protein
MKQRSEATLYLNDGRTFEYQKTPTIAPTRTPAEQPEEGLGFNHPTGCGKEEREEEN